jgi:outer membrane protein OmpA-like peptidoglycan-associated protein
VAGAFRFAGALRLEPGPDGPPGALGPEAEELLDELVDLLLRHPEVTRIRIEAHWDRSVKAEEAQRLTYQQASAVADHLAGQGIARERMVAMGMGTARPSRVPSGDRRPRDRRVEIHAEVDAPQAPTPRD